MLTEKQLEQNREILKSFLEFREIPEMYKVKEPPKPNERVPFGYIYCIENKVNHKKYVGSVYSVWVGVINPGPASPLQKRASMYIYEYNKALKSSPSVRSTLRPIIKAFLEFGIGNFIMYPIAETTKDSHRAAEDYFINKFDCFNSGYNVDKSRISVNQGKRRSQNAAEKKLRSQEVICINMNNKQIITSDSMKLFGDYIGSSKDLIKNANRNGKPHKGWFVFYTDEDKRNHILVNNVINDQNKRMQERHSEKAKKFYIELYDSVSNYIKDYSKNEYFSDFTLIPHLTYVDDNSNKQN